MNTKELQKTAKAMMAGNKGLLAMDESTETCNKRFRAVGIPETVEFRRAYRELIVTTPGLGDGLSGAILYDETVYQKTNDGVLFIDILKDAGIIPGIKVDEGAVDLANFAGEKITLGLDNLRERLAKYYQLGLRFAKWRAVLTIDKDIPTVGCIAANAHALARYAALCQEAGIVPIVEPEVLMDGVHGIKRCSAVSEEVLAELFKQLKMQRVDLRGIILKPNMVVPGKDSPKQVDVDKVARETVKCLLKSVPATVPGIAFLSGGQSPDLATAHLNAMHLRYGKKMPWALTFSFSRAIQQPALEYWMGKEENVQIAQQLLFERIMLNNDARRGEYVPKASNEAISS